MPRWDSKGLAIIPDDSIFTAGAFRRRTQHTSTRSGQRGARARARGPPHAGDVTICISSANATCPARAPLDAEHAKRSEAFRARARARGALCIISRVARIIVPPPIPQNAPAMVFRASDLAGRHYHKVFGRMFARARARVEGDTWLATRTRRVEGPGICKIPSRRKSPRENLE